MPAEARIRELDARHTELEARIAEAMKHPSADTLDVSTLKKQKLKLKEEIEQLRHRM